jgi:hypothetical protein
MGNPLAYYKMVEIIDLNDGPALSHEIRLGVRCSGLNPKEPRLAVIFAKWLAKAAEMAETSDLNGVVVGW